MFTDREDAGRRLLERLPALDPAETVILALPRGGVPIAEIIATAIGAPLDVVFVRKVGLPGHEELAVAAVTDGPEPVMTVNEAVARASGLSHDRIRQLAEPELAEIARRRQTYLAGRAALPLAGKTVVVVDDGIATGATMRASLKLVRAQGPARIILAVPVAPADTLAELASEADEIICLDTPRPFIAVGAAYRDFRQVSDDEVIAALSRASGGAGEKV